MMSCTLQIQSVIYHNEKESLIKALNSVANAVRVNRNSTNELEKVTLIYGDASKTRIFDDGEIAEMKKCYLEFFEFKYQFFNENTGTAKGHNRLGKDCTSDYMMIMNPDVIVCPGYFASIMQPFHNDELCAGMSEARQTPLEHPKEYNRDTFETDWASTACTVFPTSVFRALEGFDEKSFFMYCDDVDFSWRVRLYGKKIYYRPDAVVFHAKTLSVDGGWQPTEAEEYYSALAHMIMAHKWSNEKRCSQLYDLYSVSNDSVLLRAIKEFDRMKQNNELPEPIDKNHKVARFIGDCYTEHRFML